MPEYLSPGVYVEEIDAGPKPIEGVSTSTAGAVGVTAFGPTEGKPVLVTSFAEFVRKFGGFLPEPERAIRLKWDDPTGERGRWWQFPLAVKGFFDNGGQRIYVKRVVAQTARAASAAFGKGLVTDIAQDAPVGATTVKLAQLIGIATADVSPVLRTIKIFNGTNGNQIGAAGVGTDFTVTAYNPTTGTVTVNPALPEAISAKRGDFAEIHPRSAATVPAAEVSLTFAAKSPGIWGNDIWVRVRTTSETTLNIMADGTMPQNAAFATKVRTLTPAAGGATIEVDAATGLAQNDTILVNSKFFTVAAADTANRTIDINPPLPNGVQWTVGTDIKRIRKANTGGGSPKLNLWGAAVLYPRAMVELDNGTEKEVLIVSSIDSDTVTFTANVAKNYLEGQKARVVEAMVEVSYEPAGQPAVDESFGPLRFVDDGGPQFLVTHLKNRSAFVNATVGAGFDAANLTKFPTAPNGSWRQLAGGDDALTGLDASDFIGADNGPGKRTGIKALEDIDEISICMAPGIWAPSVLGELMIHCETLKDRFAIIDPPDGRNIEEIRSFREPIDTKYAALYYPWLKVRDPLSKQEVHVAPSAHMAGLYARVDVERGVHKAPANEVVRGISGFADDITKREQDLLNPKNINAFRYFPGRGNRVWGARVLTSDSAWKYINVRRLFIYVEESIDEGLQWVVFEPNDEQLWLRVRQTIGNFLETVWRSGALMGTKADEAFFVRCDRTTMTPADLDNGRLICLVGIAPVKPAEFVIIRIQQKTLSPANT
jgi:uncharacterized protein